MADESQINSDGMINLSVKTVDGIDLSSHNFHVVKVKKSYLGMDLLKKLDAVIHVNEEHIAYRNGLKIPFEKNNCEPIVQTSTEPFAVLSDIDWDEVSFLTDDVPEEDVPKQKQICTDDIHSEIEVVLDSYNDLFSGISKTV